MCASEGSSKFIMQLCPQKFYSNTRFQMLILKYFCSNLWPLNRSIKFLKYSKTVILFFFRDQFTKAFWVILVEKCSWWFYFAPVTIWWFLEFVKTSILIFKFERLFKPSPSPGPTCQWRPLLPRNFSRTGWLPWTAPPLWRPPVGHHGKGAREKSPLPIDIALFLTPTGLPQNLI